MFEDIMTSLNPHVEDFNQPGRRTPLGFTQGWGARMSALQTDMSQGVLQRTDNMTTLRSKATALFEVRTDGDINGARAFTPSRSVPTDAATRTETASWLTNSGQQVVGDTGAGDDFIRVPEGYNLTISYRWNVDGRR